MKYHTVLKIKRSYANLPEVKNRNKTEECTRLSHHHTVTVPINVSIIKGKYINLEA